MTAPELAFLFVVLASCVCAFIFLVQIAPRGFSGLRAAGVPASPRAVPPSFRAVIWILLPLAAVTLGVGLKSSYEGWLTRRWEAVPGTLLAAEARPVSEVRTDLFRRRLPMRRWQPYVRFSYARDGRTRTAEGLGPAEGSSAFRVLAQRRLRGLRPGPVTVYMDPADPGRAALRRGPSLPAVVCLLSGLMLSALCLWLA